LHCCLKNKTKENKNFWMIFFSANKTKKTATLSSLGKQELYARKTGIIYYMSTNLVLFLISKVCLLHLW
jgi:hypothetical protein